MKGPCLFIVLSLSSLRWTIAKKKKHPYLRRLQVPVNPNTIHFSQKIVFDNDTTVPLQTRSTLFPLRRKDFPLSKDLADILSLSRCVSVVRTNDYEVTQRVQEMIDLVGGIPPHAPEPEFWPWFEEVATYQINRRLHCNDLAITKMPWLNLPELWQNYTVHQVAEAVHDEVSP